MSDKCFYCVLHNEKSTVFGFTNKKENAIALAVDEAEKRGGLYHIVKQVAQVGVTARVEEIK